MNVCSMELSKMAADESHMVEDDVPKIKHKMGSTILDSFTQLTKDKHNLRVNGGVALLKHLSRVNANPAQSKELDYALTRLVRGLGSSRVPARKGFFAALTAFLSTHPDIQASRIVELQRSELHTVGSNSKSERAEIFIGQILACGALIHSKLLLRSTLEDQRTVLELLINAGKQRSYLSFVSYSFIIDLVKQLEEDNFKTMLWPLLKEELGKPWSEQTLDTLYVLLVITEKYPNVVKSKFLKKHIGSEEIIHETSLQSLSSILMDLPRTVCLLHPVYKAFCEKLTTTDLVFKFWFCIEEQLAKPSKSKERVSTEILTFILSSIKDKSLIPSLLTPNFLQHMLKRVLASKRNKNDEVVVKFKKLLDTLVAATKGDDVRPKTQVAVLKKLLLHPGNLMIEKTTGTRVVQMITMNLNVDGVKKLSKLYREIAAATKLKEKEGAATEPWTNAERVYAAQLLTRMMGHPAVSSEHEWRLDQLKFLFELGLCQTPNVGVELAPQIRDCFYRALDQKLPKLNDLRSILSSLVHYLDSEFFTNNDTSRLRLPFTESALTTWKHMMDLVTKLEAKSTNKRAVPIFHTMDLHMGLQLFSDTEMAMASIKELHSCFERIKSKRDPAAEEEPEWVEVVVDLLLSLLSRNNHLLRSLVGCVFPHMCPFLTATAVHQILDVLDPKNDEGPLTLHEENDSSDDDSDSNPEPDDDNSEAEASDAESSAEEPSDPEPEDDDFNADDTVNEKLRMAVRQALGDASAATDDEDVDIDKIDDAEGKRLDNALAAAFKLLRENRSKKSEKQDKNAQALTHFRVRVLDLLEMYLDSTPSLALIIDMLSPLFALLEFSIKDQHQKPLENRLRSCLKKLSSVKKFSSTEGVTSKMLVDVLKALIDKGNKSSSVCYEMGDKLTLCCTFLVRCAQQVQGTTEEMQEIYTQSLKLYFTKRDCVLPALLFKSVLHLQWEGNWRLAPLLVDFAFDNSTRPFKRGQALEFLSVFYCNNRLIGSDTEHAKTRLRMERSLCRNSVSLLRELGLKRESEDFKGIKQKFVCLLLKLLHVIRPQQQPEAWDWEAIGEAMSIYRSNLSLSTDAKSAYNRLAGQLGLSLQRTTRMNNVTTNGQKMENGGKDTQICSADEDASPEMQRATKDKKKHKNKQKQKLRKESRENRMSALSDGLGSLNFSSVPFASVNGIPEEMDDDEPVENGVAEDKTQIKHKVNAVGKSASKRSSSESSDLPVKPSKKKKK